MNVLLTGATGVLGRQLIPYLKKQYSLTALKHRREPSEMQGIKWISADLNQESSLSNSLEQIDCVIHLAAITHSNNIQRYFEVNELGTLNLVRACEVQNIKHFVFISTRAIDPAGGAYAQSKYAAEKIVESSRLNWTIIRPSEVYGCSSTEIVVKLMRIIKYFNFIPLPGDGSAKIAPLFIEDLLHFIMQIILNSKSFKKVYTLAGPTEYTLSEFADCVASYLGKKHKPFKIKIPIKAFRLFLELNGKLKLFGSLSRDQIDRLIIKKNSDITLACNDFGFNPTNIKVSTLFRK